MSNTTRSRILVSAGAALSLATLAAPAVAQNVEDCPGREIDLTNALLTGGGERPGDDGSYEYTIPTDIFPDGIPFAGAGQTRLWVNINGNLSFEGPEPAYTPNAIPGLTQPTIAPYFADVDLRSPFLRTNPGRIYICEDTDGGRLMFTWIETVFYDSSTLLANLDKRATFQAILQLLPGLCGTEDGLRVTFNYDEIEWYVGDASGGNDGVCPGGAVIPDQCTPAVAGFDAGDGETAYALPDSRTAAIAESLMELGTQSWDLRGGAVPECGNGTIDGTCEECDDAGDSEACDADCTFAACGDEYVNAAAGEECETAEATAECDADCTFPECGDGVLNEAAGETCDDGADSDACDGDCTPAECGDAYLNEAAGEACDDGNIDDGDGCDAFCVVEVVEDVGPDADDAGDVGDAEPDVAEPEPDVPDAADIGDEEVDEVEEPALVGRFSGGACHSNTVADSRTTVPWGLVLALTGLVAMRRRGTR